MKTTEQFPQLEGLKDVPRAWVLAKAAFEVAHEQNFAEQQEARARATSDDPEPNWFQDPEGQPYHAWYERNRERVDAATKPIIDRYPRALKALAEAAEENMVRHAEELLRVRFPTRYSQVAGAFDAYRQNLLFGEMREKFLKICFNVTNLD